MIRGSGKFVAIAASNSSFDTMFTNAISGVVFGKDDEIYCRVSSKYNIEQGVVTGTAFCIDPDEDAMQTATDLVLRFDTEPKLKVNNAYGYTGNVSVVKAVRVTGNQHLSSQILGTVSFKSGILVGVT